MTGNLRLHAKGTPILIPIRQGTIDFDDVVIDNVGPNSDMGVDNDGIYVDQLGFGGPIFRDHVYERHDIPGATLETYDTDGEHTYISDHGGLNLQVFLESILNAPPNPSGGAPPERISTLDEKSLTGNVSLGDDTLGKSKNNVTLSGRQTGKNTITIAGARLGQNLEIQMPEFQASKGNFELMGKAGETGLINANILVAIAGLGSGPDAGGHLRFTVTLTVVDGSVRDIKYGNVSLVSKEAMRARPAPPKEK